MTTERPPSPDDLDDRLRLLGEAIDRIRAETHGRDASPRFGEPDHERSGVRRRMVAVAAASLVVAGAAGFWVAGERRDPQSAAPSAPVVSNSSPSSPAATAPSVTTAGGAARSGPLDELLAESYPDGFVAVYERSNDDSAWLQLLRPDGVVLTVTLDLGGSDEDWDESDLADAELVDGGRLLQWEQGVIVETEAGDLIRLEANVGSIGHSDADPVAWLYTGLAPELRALALDLVGQLDGPLQDGLADHADHADDVDRVEGGGVTGSSALRTEVEQVLVGAGATVNGLGLGDPASFSFSASPPGASGVAEGELFVVAFYTAATVPSGTVVSAPAGSVPTVVAATTTIDGWVIQVVSRPGVDGGTMDAVAVATLLDQVAAPFDGWVDETAAEVGCATVIVEQGDSLASIADSQGVTLAELRAVNADLDSGFLVGAEITIPCPKTSTATG